MNKEFFNADDLIKQANAHKGELSDKKEIPKDIDKHPIDQLDILISECDAVNYEKHIEKIKELIGKHPELTGELLEEIQNQKRFCQAQQRKGPKN